MKRTIIFFLCILIVPFTSGHIVPGEEVTSNYLITDFVTHNLATTATLIILLCIAIAVAIHWLKKKYLN